MTAKKVSVAEATVELQWGLEEEGWFLQMCLK